MSGVKVTRHAARQAALKGVPFAAVVRAAEEPQVTYDVRQHPGQRRHVLNDLVAIVDFSDPDYPDGLVITVYAHKRRTPPRPDQKGTP